MFIYTLDPRHVMASYDWTLDTIRQTPRKNFPDNKVYGANMGNTWGRQDPGGPHVGPMNFALWVSLGWMHEIHLISCLLVRFRVIRCTQIRPWNNKRRFMSCPLGWVLRCILSVLNITANYQNCLMYIMKDNFCKLCCVQSGFHWASAW